MSFRVEGGGGCGNYLYVSDRNACSTLGTLEG